MEVWTDMSGISDREHAAAWSPPSPPQGAGDVYCDSWARALYRAGAASDAALPAAPRHAARAPRPLRSHRPHARAALAPLSLFERGAGRRPPRPRPPHPPAPHPPPAHPHALAPDWTQAEDAALRRALRLQRLPAEPPPARAPNWEWAAELVAAAARAYRSARACRDRHDALADPERARRRHRRHAGPRRRAPDAPRPPLHALDAVRAAAERRRHAPRRRADDAPPRNTRHAALLADHGVDYDAPPSPMEVAARRAERIARDKLKASAPNTAAPVAAPAAAAAAAAAGAASAAPTVSAAYAGGAPRIVVAAAGAAGAARPSRPEAARGAAPAQLLYRQQTFPARHLKILQQAAAPHLQSGSGEATPALRKLQLQQVARAPRAAPAAPGSAAAPPAAPPARAPHVVVARGPPPPPPPSDPQRH